MLNRGVYCVARVWDCVEGELGNQVPAAGGFCPINGDYTGTVRHAMSPVYQLYRLSGSDVRF